MAASDTNTKDFSWVLGVGLVLVGAPILGYLAAERPMLALLLLGGSAVVVALIHRPVWGVYGLLIGTAFDSVSISAGFAILGAGDLSCLLMLPMWLLHRLIHVSEMRWPLGLQYLIAFFVLSFVSMMFGVDPSIAQGGFVRLVIYGATVIAVVDLLRTGEEADRALLILAACSLIHAVVALGMGAGANYRLGGLVEQPNLLGAKIAFGLFPTVAWYLRTQSRGVRTVLIIAISVMLIAMILTISRGTYASVTLAFLWMARRNRRLVLLLAAVGGMIFIAASSYGQRQTEYVERRLTLSDSSTINRGAVARNAIRAVAENPLLGVGFGQFTLMDQVMELTAESGRGGHSFYLSTAASSGLPALFLFILFAWCQVRAMNQTIRVLDSRPPDDLDAEDRRNQWLVSTVQTIMIYHALSLTIRGSQRLNEWTMLALYAAFAILATRALERSPTRDTTESVPHPGKPGK